MYRFGGNVAAFSSTIGLLFAFCDQGHLTINDDVSCFGGMSVLGIKRVGRVVPNISCLKPFRAKLFTQHFFVPMLIHAHVLRIAAIDTQSTVGDALNAAPIRLLIVCDLC